MMDKMGGMKRDLWMGRKRPTERFEGGARKVRCRALHKAMRRAGREACYKSLLGKD